MSIRKKEYSLFKLEVKLIFLKYFIYVMLPKKYFLLDKL